MELEKHCKNFPINWLFYLRKKVCELLCVHLINQVHDNHKPKHDYGKPMTNITCDVIWYNVHVHKHYYTSCPVLTVLILDVFHKLCNERIMHCFHITCSCVIHRERQRQLYPTKNQLEVSGVWNWPQNWWAQVLVLFCGCKVSHIWTQYATHREFSELACAQFDIYLGCPKTLGTGCMMLCNLFKN